MFKKNLSKSVHSLLKKRNKTISCAESCTGGLISYNLMKFSGSSSFFKAGVTAYSNKSKTKLLHVPPTILAKYKAVSKNTAIYMANNIRKTLKTDISVSSTGIAGPNGGTKNKPVGTVYIALSSDKNTAVKKLSLKGTRQQIIKKTVNEVLKLIIKELK